jgi:hypothetical protein
MRIVHMQVRANIAREGVLAASQVQADLDARGQVAAGGRSRDDLRGRSFSSHDSLSLAKSLEVDSLLPGFWRRDVQ